MKKLFVIVDAFLDRSQQTVQAAHAVGEFYKCCPKEAAAWGNENIIIKKAKNLEPWVDDCDTTFREPYWENKVTAIAAYREEGFAKELPFV